MRTWCRSSPKPHSYTLDSVLTADPQVPVGARCAMMFSTAPQDARKLTGRATKEAARESSSQKLLSPITLKIPASVAARRAGITLVATGSVRMTVLEII
mmetsp:Transcript_30586/g.55441  ORF Transcript_30586/g.55441 Transcript_30586/m.55441 type:complete len:99 (+) Transcript_30586:68-364(+)